MQASMRFARASGAKASSSSSRSVALLRHAPFSSRPSNGSRSRSVQVLAKKGQKGRVGYIPGQQEMVRVEPPVPEVDAENAEFVIFCRAKKFQDERLKVTIQNSPWVPLTIVKGGQAANFLVKAMESEWGRKLYAKTLLKNIGLAVYKDREKIERNLKSQTPTLKNVPSGNFEYAMKIRDKSVPKDWFKADNLTIFPPESQLQGTALDDLKKFFSAETLSSLFGGSPAAAATSPASSADTPKQQ